MGRQTNGTFYAGALDDIRIYNRSLYQSEIISLSTSFPQPLLNPTSYWSLNEGSGSYAYDYSGLSNHGTLVSSPIWTTGISGSALSFNKRDCLSVLKTFGIICANSYYINKGNIISEEEIIKKVGLPCFVKPNRAGSSFGISKVYKMAKFTCVL